jgi:hypothetical protein
LSPVLITGRMNPSASRRIDARAIYLAGGWSVNAPRGWTAIFWSGAP